jgi:hypothetical protein
MENSLEKIYSGEQSRWMAVCGAVEGGDFFFLRWEIKHYACVIMGVIQ